MARIPADVRRRELVEAAIRVLTRDGIAKATTRVIVTEAGMPLGFFHYCFRSKQELLLQVIETINDRNVAAARSVLERHRDDRDGIRNSDRGRGRSALRDTLRSGLRAYLQEVQQRPGEHQLTYELTQYALRQPGMAEVARRQYEHYLAATSDFLERAAAAAQLTWTTPLPLLSRYALNVIDGVTLAWVVDRDTAAACAVLDEFVEHVCTETRG